jgi:hypothetical protein
MIYEIIFWSIDDDLLKVRVEAEFDESPCQWEGRLLMNDPGEWPDDQEGQIDFLDTHPGIDWEIYNDSPF